MAQELPDLNHRQAKYLENVTVKGMSKREAAREAGYAPGVSSTTIEQSPTLKNALTQALNRRGLTEDYIAKKLCQGTKAFDVHHFTHQGKVIESKRTVDFQTRERYLKTILEVQGYLKNSTIENLNIGLISIPEGQKDSIGWNDTIKEGEQPL